MSSPEIPPESTPPPQEQASPPLLPPTSLPLPPIAVIASSPLLSPPAPPLSPSPDPSPATPASSPSLPSLPSFPPKSPPQLPLLSPPKPPASSTPPPAPALSISPPAPALSLPPPKPALSLPPPAPALSVPPPAPALSTHLPSHPAPASSKTPPTSPVKPAKPNPPSSSSTPSTATPKPSPQRRHSSARSPSSSSSSSSSRSTTPPGSKPLPTTISSAPPPVASPTSQPFTGGGSADDMPLTAEKPAPQPSVPLTVGGGSRPAMAVLPAGANGGSNIQAATAGRGGGMQTAGVSTGIIAGLCVGGVVLVALLVFGILLVFCKRKKGDRFDDCGAFACDSKSDSQGKLSLPTYTKGNTSFPDTQIIGGSLGSAISASGMALVSIPLAVPYGGTFTYEELVLATNGFSESNLLGQGGFGYVHKGVLPNGKEVAVKQLKMGGQQGEREFRAEVETISQVHHKHLVSLVGYCIAGAERLLVYEFVPNQTMDFHLHGKDQPVMEWSTRLRIAIGSAKGLAYLHEDCNPTIIHRDIKAANILLDFNCEVKVSDFGLAKIFSNTNSSITHITTRVVGTFGYLAPEYASSGKVTDKSDVYSYGVMLLELITGRPPITTSESAMNGSLVNWARPLLPKAIEEGNFDTLVDPRLQNSYNVDEMANMVACAAACVRLSAWRRPRMSQVIRALEGDLSPSDLDDGVRPGHSSMQFPYESLDFDAQKYMEDMRKLRMALSSNSNEGASANGTRYSDNTSEYGLQPSISSADSHELNTRSLRLGRD